jgi:hypothetical protein
MKMYVPGLALALSIPGPAENVVPEEARKIAKEATIYGFPMVDSYRIQYSYFVNEGGRSSRRPSEI